MKDDWEDEPTDDGQQCVRGSLDGVLFHESDRAMLESLVNDAEYVGRRLSTNCAVPGNISKPQFREFWEKEIKPSEKVLDIIRNGYSLPFRSLPPPSFERNNRSALNDMEFCRAEVRRLESLGCIREVFTQPYIVNPISSIYSKKKRLVVDCSRALNPFLTPLRVRLQDHRDVPLVVKQNHWLCVEDLDSGYWHCKIKEEDQKFLGIHIFDEKGQVHFYVWQVLFLGISSAVHLFTMLLRPIRRYIQSKGIGCLIYLDDSLFLGDGEEGSKKNRDIAVNILKKAGFIVSESKSKGPSPRLEFLGLEVDAPSQHFFIPERKVCRIIETAGKLVKERKVKIRMLASWLGLLMSCSRALGSIVRLRTRASYHWMNELLESSSYDHHYPLSDRAKEELLFWVERLRSLNGYSFSPELSCSETNFVVVSDASSQGFFAFQLADKYKVLARRQFTPAEVSTSSTMRELLALLEVYNSEAANDLEGNVTHYTDNQAVCSVMEIGSNKQHLNDIVLKILEAAKAKNISLRCEWKPRNNFLLQHADLGSKAFDDAAISLNFDSFAVILEYFQHVPLQVDCMAQAWNRKADIFYSKSEEEGSSGVNFFSQNLNPNLSHYCFPPVSCIVAAILHLARFGCTGLLVLPEWRSCSYWTNVLPDGKHLPVWVRGFLRFKPSGFILDPAINSNTFRSPIHYDLVVINFNFKNIRKEELNVPFIAPSHCFDFGCEQCLK